MAVQRMQRRLFHSTPVMSSWSLSQHLFRAGLQVFCKDSSLYAFKGLSGRLGPIGVHASMLLILFGTAYSGFGGYHGSVMAPEVSSDSLAQSLGVRLPTNGLKYKQEMA